VLNADPGVTTAGMYWSGLGTRLPNLIKTKSSGSFIRDRRAHPRRVPWVSSRRLQTSTGLV